MRAWVCGRGLRERDWDLRNWLMGCGSRQVQIWRERTDPAYIWRKSILGEREGTHRGPAAEAQAGDPGKRRRRTHVPRQSGGRSPSSLGDVSLSLKAFNWLDEAHPHYGGKICFTQPTDLNVNSIYKYLHRDIEIYVWLNIWVPWPSQIDT